MLSVNNLTFSYGRRNSQKPVFEKLNLEFGPGLNTILGPNGAGKTTLLKSMFGLLKYDGVIYCGDENVTTMKTSEKTKLMSYLPQMDIDLSMLTVLEMVLLGRLPELTQRVNDEDIECVTNTLEALNISSLASRPFGELSGGQKKLVFIAQTLVREPKLILLDEPFNSLDLQKQLELCHLLRKIIEIKGVSVIAVLHDINLAARFSDHIVILDKNGAFHSSGTPFEVITEGMLREVYGVLASVRLDENNTPTISPIRSIRDV